MPRSASGSSRGRGAYPAARPHPDWLRFVYVGRMVVVSGILLAALAVWGQAGTDQTFLATAMFVAALVVTLGGVWHTHIQNARPGPNFLSGQVLFDVLMVTGVVHLTGGASSAFAWIYILVISEGALLLPLPGGILIGPLVAVLYFADIVWAYAEPLTGSVLLQTGLFAFVAFVTGVLGDRLRRAGDALGAARTELHRLRTDTGDILETISTGILTVEEPGRVMYLNSAARSLLRVEEDAARGAEMFAVVGRVSPGLLSLLEASFEEGASLSRREVTAARGDDRITLGVSTTFRAAAEAPAAVTAIFQDITDLQKLEMLNRRNERLEAVAELSAAMAHEIRNPLQSIRSAVEQFARPSLDAADEEKLVRMVVRESDRLSRLLSDFIDFSKVRIGHLEPVSLDRVVGECVAVLGRHPEVEEKGVRIDVVPATSGIEIPADPDLLHRALFNLVLNAVQFSPRGSSVEVRVDDLRVSGAPSRLQISNPILIRVRDRGPGVPEDLAERIFDPFFTTRDGGSGLGLSVVYRAVDAHGGLVYVDRWQEGAEFNLYLPGTELSAGVSTNG